VPHLAENRVSADGRGIPGIMSYYTHDSCLRQGAATALQCAATSFWGEEVGGDGASLRGLHSGHMTTSGR
jgi:hypothetical protein